MIYSSVDIETTGKQPTKNDILSIAAIIEDTNNPVPYVELPKFNAIVIQEQLTGSPFALNLNKGIIELLGFYVEGSPEKKKELTETSGYKFYTKDEIIPEFYRFLKLHLDGEVVKKVDGSSKGITINVAGKNFGTFDKLFLEQMPWWKKLINIRQRILDPAILFTNWKEDEHLPNMSVCKERLGVNNVVSHIALEDAWDVIQLLRTQYNEKPRRTT